MHIGGTFCALFNWGFCGPQPWSRSFIFKSVLSGKLFEGTGLRKMALRKLAYEALKEKHHIPKSEHAIRSKVALMLVFIQLMELVFLSRGRQFLVIFLQP